MSDQSTLPAQMHAPGSAVAARPQAAGNDTLDANDVRLPRLKLAQMISKAVENGVVNYGDIFVSHGQDDMEPVVLAEGPKKGDLSSPPVIFYVLGVQKGYSYSDPNGRLGRTLDGSYPNLSLVKGQDPKNVRRTYDYLLVVPEYPDLPVKFIMHGAWGGQAAKSLNTRLVLAQQKGIPQHEVPFKLQVQKTENDRGAFARAIVAPADVPAKDREAHQALVQDFLGLVASANVSAVDDDVPVATAEPVDAPSLD